MADENITHFGGVRMRVNGSGNLRMKFQSLDNIKQLDLVPFIMSGTTDKEPFRLANFVSQRGKLKVSTTAINETFKINRIIIYVKPIYTSFPG